MQTLQDNTDYIRRQLQDTYQTDQPENLIIKDPYELARQSGYELTGPFNKASDVEAFQKDFRSGEELCTFRAIDSRLYAYNILWLRHQNADNTLPADELTQDNLTDEWKQYLKHQDKYNAETDKYKLSNLKPSRQDPYGTSSMSVQISRTGSHVSIKNRYNHTVYNPDATFDNNLDNIIPGLRTSIYNQVDRLDIEQGDVASIDINYVLDNDGGIHEFYMERDNSYYGHYEYIKNGEVTKISTDKYQLLSPTLYIKRGKHHGIIDEKNQPKDNEQFINLFTEYPYNSVVAESNPDGSQSLIFKDNASSAVTYTYGNQEKIDGIDPVTMLVSSEINSVEYNPALTELLLDDSAMVRFITNNPQLQNLYIANNATIVHIRENPQLKSIVTENYAHLGYICGNPNLQSFIVGDESIIQSLSRNDSLKILQLDEYSEIRAILDNSQLEEITISNNSSVSRISGNQSLKTIFVSNDSRALDISFNSSLESIHAMNNVIIDSVQDNKNLKHLTIDDGSAIRIMVAANPELETIELGERAIIDSIIGNEKLETITINDGSQIRRIAYNDRLKTITKNGTCIVVFDRNNPMLRQ